MTKCECSPISCLYIIEMRYATGTIDEDNLIYLFKGQVVYIWYFTRGVDCQMCPDFGGSLPPHGGQIR